jgi:hypothetical protein
MNTDYESKVRGNIGLIKIAIDMHLRSYCVVRQFDHSAPQPAQKFEPEGFYRWLGKQQRVAQRVVVCYEAGCFGYVAARRMRAMGAEVLVKPRRGFLRTTPSQSDHFPLLDIRQPVPKSPYLSAIRVRVQKLTEEDQLWKVALTNRRRGLLRRCSQSEPIEQVIAPLTIVGTRRSFPV